MALLDIVFVTYQSEKWIAPCIDSLNASDFDLREVSLYFVDNASTDNSYEVLLEQKKKYGDRYGCFCVEKQEENLGFGKGNNVGASYGSAPYLLFLNIDTEVFPDTLSELFRAVHQDSGSAFGAWELRQYPFEHPKHYDPVTGETSWSSGAAFAIKREIFEQIGGFDPQIFMYAEDVDISWRVRMEGYAIHYIPRAVVNHYCYQSAGEVKPTQYVYSTVNNQLLRYKFGTYRDIFAGYLYLGAKMLTRSPYRGAKASLVKGALKQTRAYMEARKWHRVHAEEIKRQSFSFLRMDYELRRSGAFWAGSRPSGEKKVSVVVRTCGRPSVLRETLKSLRNQTYSNMEIVVVEDGPATAETMIRTEFPDLSIRYEATGQKVGRCTVGNRGLSLATGEYLCFLDDDDLFYADHLETLMVALEENPDYQAAYTSAFETPIRVKSKEPYTYEVLRYDLHFDAPFSRLELIEHNLFPIQAVLFHRSLYEAYGGFDESMDVLEDWDLWLRYASKDNFLYVPKTTSIYRVPADRAQNDQRQKRLDEAYTRVLEKHQDDILQWKMGDILRELNQPARLLALCSRSYTGVMGFCFKAMRKIYALFKSVSR